MRCRTRRNSAASSARRSRPSNSMAPSLGRSSWFSVRSSVLLPAPLRPMMPKTSPSRISRLMSRNARTSPEKVLPIPRKEKSAVRRSPDNDGTASSALPGLATGVCSPDCAACVRRNGAARPVSKPRKGLPDDFGSACARSMMIRHPNNCLGTNLITAIYRSEVINNYFDISKWKNEASARPATRHAARRVPTPLRYCRRPVFAGFPNSISSKEGIVDGKSACCVKAMILRQEQ